MAACMNKKMKAIVKTHFESRLADNL